MAVLSCYVDDRTLLTLQRISEETGRGVEELAESAIAEAAIDADRDLPIQGKDNA